MHIHMHVGRQLVQRLAMKMVHQSPFPCIHQHSPTCNNQSLLCRISPPSPATLPYDTNQVDDAARECGVRGEYDSGDVDLRSDEGRDWEKDYMDAIRAVGVDSITVRGQERGGV